MPNKMISKRGYKRLLVAVVGIFLFFSLISVLIVYKNLHIPIGPHYAAAHFTMNQIKGSLITKTILINLIFLVLTSVGISLLGIFYSHRVAGPLFKVKQHAQDLGKGRFDERIRFRKKDAIHSLADGINEVSQNWEERIGLFSAKLKEMEDVLNSYGSILDDSRKRAGLTKRLKALDAEIREKNQEMKL